MPLTHDYPRLREAVNSELARLPTEQFEAALENYNIEAEAMEGWLNTLGSIAQVALPIAGKVVGSVFGGPVGGALGGSLGSLAGGAVGSLTGQRPASPSMPSARPGGGPIPGGSPAAGQLMQTLIRPETMQALMSMMMGSAGRSNVQVGSTPVPVGAFTNLLGNLVNQAASEYEASLARDREAIPEYLRNAAGEAVADIAVDSNRADALRELLERTPLESEGFEVAEAAEYSRFATDAEAADRAYDAMDLGDIGEFAEDY